MHFTYRGFFENPQNVPARIMKQKLLHRNDSEPTAKGFAYDEDVKSTMIADFSAVDVFGERKFSGANCSSVFR